VNRPTHAPPPALDRPIHEAAPGTPGKRSKRVRLSDMLTKFAPSKAVAVLCLSLLFPSAVEARGQIVQLPKVHAYEVWNTCDDGDFSIERLAQKLRPALWFAPQEPLKDLLIPQAWRLSAAADQKHVTVRTAYYRVRRLRAVHKDDDLLPELERLARPRDISKSVESGGGDRIARLDQEAFALLDWDADALAHLKEVTIRYLYYYPIDIGVGEHLHDLEAVDVDVSRELRVDVERQRSCSVFWVRQVHGAAHGVGLYTNSLNVEAVEAETEHQIASVTDADLIKQMNAARLISPLTIFVEAGKHASAPSRDGNKQFDMGFDVNMTTADAWGIRDTMRSNRLAPMFTDSMASIRELAPDDLPRCKSADSNGSFLESAGSPSRMRVCPSEYRLIRTTHPDTAICGTQPIRAARDASLTQFALRHDRFQPRVQALLRDKGFCRGAELDEADNVLTFLQRHRIGVSHNPFGKFAENLGITYRQDRSAELSFIVPLGWEIGGLGGWLTPRVGLFGPANGQRGSWLTALDVTYARSASAFLSPYVRAGADFHVCQGADAERPACRDERHRVALALDSGIDDAPGSTRAAWEGGVAFRVKIWKAWLPLLGGKIGVRGNSWSEPRHVRIVFELGSAVW